MDYGILFCLCFGLLAVFTNVHSTTPGDQVRQLENILFLHIMEEYPEYASKYNDNYNDLLESYTLEAFEKRKVSVERLLADVYQINTTLLTRTEFLDLKILREHLQTYLDGYKWRLYGNLNPINNKEGVIKNHNWLTGGIYDEFKYIRRLHHLHRQIEEMTVLMKLAVELNRTNPISTMDKSLDRIDHDSNMVLKLARNIFQFSLSNKSRQMMLVHVPNITTSFNKLKSFLDREYIPACRKAVGLKSLEGGLEYYKAILKFYLDTDDTPEQVHNLGIREIRRIKYNMAKVMHRLEFHGSLHMFYKHIKRRQVVYNKTKNDIIKEYERLIYQEISPKLSTVFSAFPDQRIRIVPVDDPRFTAWAAYQDNNFFVKADDSSPTMMLALTLHEANPGHHFQDNYVKRTNLPSYRKFPLYGRTYSVPFTFPTYSAYIEGWALYAEFLGEEMGLFSDPYNLFGRYVSEMLRACRLVIDTGIHAFGWSRQRAIRFLMKYTDFTYESASAEIDRYIIWPGHACSYKIGELKIKELRQKAQTSLGALFDVKEFHHQILKVGPVSLTILEEVITEWIQMKQFAPTNAMTSLKLTYLYCLLMMCLSRTLQTE